MTEDDYEEDLRQVWEYLIVDYRGQSNEKDQKDMNARGKNGWELVAIADGIAYFKRIKL